MLLFSDCLYVEEFMNKVLFLILTLVVLIVGMYVFDIVAAEYILSDYYVPIDVSGMEDDEAMPFEEYLERIQNGDESVVENFEMLPWDIKMMQFRSMSYRIFIFVISVVLSIFAGFVIKSNRIDFGYLRLDSSERIINMVRIALYVSTVMLLFIIAQKYVFAFLLGWLSTVIWTVILVALNIWILNIIYAFKERRALKKPAIKPLGK
jgi:hypothetical protein